MAEGTKMNTVSDFRKLFDSFMKNVEIFPVASVKYDEKNTNMVCWDTTNPNLDDVKALSFEEFEKLEEEEKPKHIKRSEEFTGRTSKSVQLNPKRKEELKPQIPKKKELEKKSIQAKQKRGMGQQKVEVIEKKRYPQVSFESEGFRIFVVEPNFVGFKRVPKEPKDIHDKVCNLFGPVIPETERTRTVLTRKENGEVKIEHKPQRFRFIMGIRDPQTNNFFEWSPISRQFIRFDHVLYGGDFYIPGENSFNLHYDEAVKEAMEKGNSKFASNTAMKFAFDTDMFQYLEKRAEERFEIKKMTEESFLKKKESLEKELQKVDKHNVQEFYPFYIEKPGLFPYFWIGMLRILKFEEKLTVANSPKKNGWFQKVPNWMIEIQID